MEKIKLLTLTIFFLFAMLALPGLSQPQCGKQAGNKPCPNNQCCSQYGYCGTTPEYCENNCQSQCTGGGGDIGSIVTPAIFDEMLKHRTTGNCVGQVYTYTGFIDAAKSFTGFGTTGDSNARKRELAAFFSQTSHETTGGWPGAPDGQDKWGYCYVRELDQSNTYCVPTSYPCAPNQKYFGRGPIQISYNYNYAQFGNKIGRDLINNPDLVATDPTISFQSAIWFWMTPQGNKPSSHNVIIGQWTPSAADRSAGRVPGFGVITNIINGGIECGNGPNDKSNDRIGFYKRYCQMLGVTPGDNLDCNNQKSFNIQMNTNPKTGTECHHEGRIDTVI